MFFKSSLCSKNSIYGYRNNLPMISTVRLRTSLDWNSPGLVQFSAREIRLELDWYLDVADRLPVSHELVWTV